MKDIVAFDVETTGLDKKNDYIIQLSLVKIDGETFKEKGAKNYYIKPIHAYTIQPSAQEVHGITKEFLEKNGVNLKDIIPEIIDFIGDSDYLTYNGNSFDVQFIYKDFELLGFEFPIEGHKFYDAYALEARFFPRDLSTIYKKYTGKELEGAHDALADVRGTIEVFKGQLNNQHLMPIDIKDWNECNMTSPEGSIRFSNAPGKEDNLVFAIGKYRDSEFIEVYKKDPQYIEWFGKNVASNYTKKIINEYCKKKFSKK